MDHYDAIIIGAGQGGGPIAGKLAQAGQKVALVERKHVGGTCVNEGCTPTKTMVASARVAYLARRAADYGVQVGDISVDMGVVRQRKRDIVEMFRSGSESGITSKDGLDLIMGEASFTGDKTLNVTLNEGGSRTLSADTIIINTGQRPNIPPIDGLDSVDYLDSTSIMELGEVPDKLVVIGGGYIGLEFGQMFRRFGAEVTLLQRGASVAKHEDDDISNTIVDIFRDDGIEVVLHADATSVRQDDGEIVLSVDVQGEVREVRGSHLLVATGRTPNTDALNLSSTSIEVDRRGYIVTSADLRTNVPGVYAIGDVRGEAAFTHISYDDARLLEKILIDGQQATTTGRLVPYTMFIDPQLARVGLSEQEARERGLPIRVAKMPMTSAARAIEIDETRGLMKAIVHADTERILGCVIFGHEGGEVMSVVQVAMMANLPYTALRDGVFAHPTLTESLNNLFATLD
ncbi:MAG: mercuric reductase [Trueperaceae bacterium]|nr:mercuric reductase [Trueperaceae bacterium]